ncbi:MAG: RIP metalloprotease RseP [Planctomycetes bacterium]|nr:RIP metalloprotease RseP [Planctomycetota bacterium]
MLPLIVLANVGQWLSNAAGSLGFWLLAAGGIGLVIFVHELGHFLVAKKCGVRVEAFAIGFGPRLFGFKRGDTEYRLGLIPIGGYVKMAGDNPGDSLQGDGTDLPSKTVGQRFAIYVAGVVMNLLFAVIALPIVLAVGVQFHSTTIGSVQPGGPAWKAGIEKGDEVLAIDGHRADDFNDVIAEVALSGADGVVIEFLRTGPEGAPRTQQVAVQPEFDRAQGRYVIGVAPSLAATFDVDQDGPAARAGIKKGERIVAFDGVPLADVDAFEPRRIDNKRTSVTLRVADRAGGERDVVVEPTKQELPTCVVGIKPYQSRVKALRGRAAASDLARVDDELIAIARKEGEGPATIVAAIGDADEMAAAFAQAGALGGQARLLVRRDGALLELALPAGFDAALATDIALMLEPPGRRIRVVSDFPAALAGMESGGEIVKVNQVAVANWAEIKQRVDKAVPASPDGSALPLEFTLLYADGRETSVTVTPRVEQPPVVFGLVPTIAMVERSYPLPEAVRVGVSSAGYMLKNVYLTLKKILVREVSASNLSGILTIAYVSRSFAESGIATLFFFLAVLSLNLAFLNLLPIPVLDGGHLFFLLVEKVKGSPVSDKVMGFSQLVGLVLVLALLLFVTYNDLRRFISW